jgi:hypothetical protein
MDINLGRNRQAEPSDTEIERDVAELRRLLAGVEGPQEPHPAYWQNFVVRVRGRIDEQGAGKKRWSFSTAWASVGAAAIVTIAVVSGIFSPERAGNGIGTQGNGPVAVKPAEQPVENRETGGDLAAHYRSSDASNLVLSGEDVRLISAIVSTDSNDDALFEALVESDEM